MACVPLVVVHRCRTGATWRTRSTTRWCTQGLSSRAASPAMTTRSAQHILFGGVRKTSRSVVVVEALMSYCRAIVPALQPCVSSRQSCLTSLPQILTVYAYLPPASLVSAVPARHVVVLPHALRPPAPRCPGHLLPRPDRQHLLLRDRVRRLYT